MTIEEYISNINQRYLLGNATEHTFRGDLQQLLESLIPTVRATNEPKRQACGAPDYILTKKDIPVGFIEAKDIGDKDLEGKKKSVNKEQFDRYKASLDNLIFTDYINFHFYKDGELITKIAIAKVTEKGIVAIPENFRTFEDLMKSFCEHIGQNIKSSKRLAEMMAGKARLLSDVIEKSLNSDQDNEENSTLKEQMNAFKEILVHDITAKGFADVYAQTIAYGMFAARLHDPTIDTFSRQEAAELIPKSNPFLRKLFGYIAGPDIDDRIKWIVDNLTEIFLACNVEEILKNYGKSTKMEDPIIHFYENFLAEYDPKLRKARGVWYTPAPVVNFIVRAVDDILKTEFDLPKGLADSSKTTIKVDYKQIADKRTATGYKQVEKQVHKVQILDPATGTGTFLAEVIKHVHKKFKGQEGIWSSYVENDLIPRLNGFELLMASYAMAHLQIDLLLKKTGFKPTKTQRTRIYLTNSLEEAHPDAGTLFSNWLSKEANEANSIKRDSPVMCIMGNPPYAISSTNKSDWIIKLLEDYKKDLKEKSYNSLSDDYVKFIRYGQYFVDKNEEGILAYVSNNSFIDGIVFRQMRKSLLESFDKLYILDLHGNSKKKEVCLDGSVDQNVFDIMQGVSINIFVKTGKKKKGELGKVFNYDLFGKREVKYDFLKNNSLKSIEWNIIKNKEPEYYFIKKDWTLFSAYEKGFLINKVFIDGASGVKTERDSLVIHKKKDSLEKTIYDFKNLEIEEFRTKYNERPDGRDWKMNLAKKDLLTNKNKLIQYGYKPFDTRWTCYTGTTKGFMAYPRQRITEQFIDKNNYALVSMRKLVNSEYLSSILITNTTIDLNFYGFQTYAFPLYLYPDTTEDIGIEGATERVPNLDKDIVADIAKKIGLVYSPNPKEAFVTGKDIMLKSQQNNPNNSIVSKKNHSLLHPIDILDYIYAVLHSPTYREKYKEFLKIDFPRVPYPKDVTTFWELVSLGKQIREIHLLENEKVEDYITSYPIGGSNTITTKVGKKDWEITDTENGLGRIWINEEQYFDNIPLVAWEFYIGGYQPAQKWLKDRKQRELDIDDIMHYQKIIVALTETDRLMKEINKLEIE